MDLSDVDNEYVAKSREIFDPKGLRLLLRQPEVEEIAISQCVSNVKQFPGLEDSLPFPITA